MTMRTLFDITEDELIHVCKILQVSMSTICKKWKMCIMLNGGMALCNDTNENVALFFTIEEYPQFIQIHNPTNELTWNQVLNAIGYLQSIDIKLDLTLNYALNIQTHSEILKSKNDEELKTKYFKIQ